MQKKRSIAVLLVALTCAMILITISMPDPVLGQSGAQPTPRIPFPAWCCAFRVKPTIPFVWIRSAPGSNGDIIYTLDRGVTVSVALSTPDLSFDGVQWWGHIRSLYAIGWVELNSLQLVPVVNYPKAALVAKWKLNDRVRVRAGVPFVWQRPYPSSLSAVDALLPQASEMVVLGTPAFDNRQWWWPVRSTVDYQQVGWVEQASLELARLTPPVAPSAVPTGTPVRTAPPPSVLQVPVTVQTFENGWMIWRSDTGEIYLLANFGRFSTFLPANYGRLPNNPVTLQPPSGRFKPDVGFGKIWGNDATVRAHLGWATAWEFSYVSTIFGAPNRLESLTLPDHRLAIVDNFGHWAFPDRTLPPPGIITLATETPVPTPTSITITAAFQQFENGFMIWRSDNDLIYVMLNSGEVKPGYSARGLQDNPVTDTPPAGKTKPVSGFGRVWGNYVDVRNALGWALGNEVGYSTFINAGPITSSEFPPALYFSLKLPDGRNLSVGKRSWQFLN